MPYSHILFQVEESGIAVLTVNRPQKLNALSAAVIDELSDAFGRVASDSAIRALILTGAGEKAFVAGADIAELAELSPLRNARLGAARAGGVPPPGDLRQGVGGRGEWLRAGRRAGTGDGVHGALRGGQCQTRAAGSEARVDSRDMAARSACRGWWAADARWKCCSRATR